MAKDSNPFDKNFLFAFNGKAIAIHFDQGFFAMDIGLLHSSKYQPITNEITYKEEDKDKEHPILKPKTIDLKEVKPFELSEGMLIGLGKLEFFSFGFELYGSFMSSGNYAIEKEEEEQEKAKTEEEKYDYMALDASSWFVFVHANFIFPPYPPLKGFSLGWGSNRDFIMPDFGDLNGFPLLPHTKETQAEEAEKERAEQERKAAEDKAIKAKKESVKEAEEEKDKKIEDAKTVEEGEIIEAVKEFDKAIKKAEEIENDTEKEKAKKAATETYENKKWLAQRTRELSEIEARREAKRARDAAERRRKEALKEAEDQEKETKKKAKKMRRKEQKEAKKRAVKERKQKRQNSLDSLSNEGNLDSDPPPKNQFDKKHIDHIQGEAGEILEELDLLEAYMVPEPGTNWAAIGGDFAFSKIKIAFIAVFRFHDGWSLKGLGLLGNLSFVLKSKNTEAAIADIDLNFELDWDIKKGKIAFFAVLSPRSFILLKNIKLSGGILFMKWLKGDKEGDWVFRVGGFYPGLDVPGHYKGISAGAGIKFSSEIGKTKKDGSPVKLKTSVAGLITFAQALSFRSLGLRAKLSMSFGSKLAVSIGIGLNADALIGWLPQFFYRAKIGLGLEVSIRGTVGPVTISIYFNT